MGSGCEDDKGVGDRVERGGRGIVEGVGIRRGSVSWTVEGV